MFMNDCFQKFRYLYEINRGTHRVMDILDKKDMRDQSSSLSHSLLNYINFFLKDTLSTNAILLLATWCMNAAIGFVFIILAARMYSINAVGIAMLLIAYANVVVLFTRFGIEQSMIRYFEETEKSAIYCATVLATTIPAVIVGMVLCVISYLGLLGQDVLSQYSFIFIIAILLLSVNEVSGFLFLAKGRPFLYLAQSVVIALRLLFLVILVPYGTLGLFSALVLALVLSMLFSLLLVRHQGVHPVIAGRVFLAESFHFSMGNYIGDFLQSAPVFLLPIMIFALFGEKDTAIYSVGYAVASIAFLIPTAIGYATFISGCRDDTRTLPVKKLLVPTLLLLGALILVFFFWGTDILGILGPQYAGTASLVVPIMGASLFALFFQIYTAGFKVQKEIRKLILLNGAFFVAVMGMSCLFMLRAGLVGAGYAWVAAYAVCVIPLGCYTIYKKGKVLSPLT
jgi:O-antigen/teichoic acid export membrane protein